LKQTNQVEAGFMKIMNSCLIRVELMKIMTPQIVIGLIKIMLW